MLRRIRVQRYKSIVDVTLELGSVNVLHGETCAGKTNLLEGLALLSAAASGRVDRGLHHRRVRSESTHACTLRSVPRGPIELEAASDRVCYRVKLDENDLSYMAEVVEVDGAAVLAREHTTGWATLAGCRVVLSALPDEGMAVLLRATAGRGVGPSFVRVLEDLAIINPADVVRDRAGCGALRATALEELSSLVPAATFSVGMGPGALSMLGLLLALFSKSAPRVLAIDGPDPALSRAAASAFAARVRALVIERERQLLWSTNMPGALDALRDDDGARVFRVGRDRQGATTIETVGAAEAQT